MKKYIARQVDPAFQQSPLDYYSTVRDDQPFDEYPDISFYGNRRYRARMTEAFDDVYHRMNDMICAYEEYANEPSEWASFEELVDEYTPNCGKFTVQQFEAWKLLLNECIQNMFPTPAQENDFMCRAMEIITGKPHYMCDIHGSCQGDWQTICYPADYGLDSIKCLEMEYFNEGSEWSVSEEMLEVTDDVEEMSIAVGESCYYQYCYEYQPDAIKQEIADAMGCKAEDVLLLEHNGYVTTSQYKIV